MSLNTVTLTWDLTDFLQAGVHATLALTPNAVLTDGTNHLVIPEVQHSVQFINGTGSLAGIIACDNSTILPSGWAYNLTVGVLGQGQILNETVQINFASGATQDLSDLIPLSPAPSLLAYLPLPSGTPTPGYVPVATGTAEGSVWGPNGTGGSGYPALPVVSGTPSAGQVLTATSGTAADWQTPSGGGGGINPPAGDIGGTAGAPTVVSTHLSAALPVAQGGTGQTTQQAALDALAGAQTAAQYLRGNGTHVAMSAIQAADVPALNQNTTGTAANITGTLDQVPAPVANVSLNSHKVTNLSNGTAATDAAAFGQIPSSLPPNGSASGDLGGSYPSPTVTGTHLASALPVNQGGTGSTTRNFAGLLTPTAVKTGAYGALAGDYVPCDTTSAGFTVTLPNAPADLTVIGVKQVIQGGTNTVTIAAAGSDVFNKAGGPASLTLTLLNQGVILQYKASSAIWYVFADDLALSALDSRYVASVTAADTSVVVGGTAAAPTVRTGTLDVIAADHPAAADWSNNSHKITSLANGSAATDAAAYGQTPAGGNTATIAQGGTGQTSAAAAYNALSPMTTTGDMEYDSSGGTAARLPVGSNGQVLAVQSGVPTWLAVSNLAVGTTSAAGVLELDGTATDIQPLGTQAAGASAKAAAANHVHPLINDYVADDHALLAWAYDPTSVQAGTVVVAGTVQLIKVILRTQQTITNVILHITSAGSGLTASQNFAGLYNSSGTLLSATADQSGTWNSSGLKTIALTTQQTGLAAGVYYVAIVSNGTTPPSFGRSASVTAGGALINVGLTAAASRFATGPAAQTSLPGSITMSSNAQAAVGYWAALS